LLVPHQLYFGAQVTAVAIIWSSYSVEGVLEAWRRGQNSG